MKRTAIATACVLGATVPLLAAVVFLFGCCVLPFHGVIHKAMPFCDMAAGMLRGEQRDHHQQPVPARERQEPVKRMATDLPRSFHVAAASSVRHAATPVDAAGHRSFIALGAIRCDQDVGLHLLVGTLLI